MINKSLNSLLSPPVSDLMSEDIMKAMKCFLFDTVAPWSGYPWPSDAHKCPPPKTYYAELEAHGKYEPQRVECFANLWAMHSILFWCLTKKTSTGYLFDLHTWWHTEDKPKDDCCQVNSPDAKLVILSLNDTELAAKEVFEVKLEAWSHGQGLWLTVSAYPKSSSMKTKLNDTQRCKHFDGFLYFSFKPYFKRDYIYLQFWIVPVREGPLRVKCFNWTQAKKIFLMISLPFLKEYISCPFVWKSLQVNPSNMELYFVEFNIWFRKSDQMKMSDILKDFFMSIL